MEGPITWYQSNGDELWRTWVANYVEIWRDSGKRMVRRSRKDHVCVLGFAIPAGSSYLRLEVLAGGGCGTSGISVACCSDHVQALSNGEPQGWIVDLTGEGFFDSLRSLDD